MAGGWLCHRILIPPVLQSSQWPHYHWIKGKPRYGFVFQNTSHVCQESYSRSFFLFMPWFLGFRGFSGAFNVGTTNHSTATHSFCHFIGWWFVLHQTSIFHAFLVDHPNSREPKTLVVWVDVSPFPRGYLQVRAVCFLGGFYQLLPSCCCGGWKMPRYWPRGDPWTRETVPDDSSWEK